jgi:hypothetical protein
LAAHGAGPAAEDFCHAIGYRRITRKDHSALAVRADVLERLAREAYRLAAQKPAAAPEGEVPVAEAPKAAPAFAAGPALCALADCNEVDLEALLFALGYRRHGSVDGQPQFQRKGALRRAPPGGAARKTEDTAAAAKPERHKGKSHEKRKPDPAEVARAARREAARLREEKRMADSPFAILRQLTVGGE